MCKTGDARWAWAQIVQKGVVVQRVQNLCRYRTRQAPSGSLCLQYALAAQPEAWLPCDSIRFGDFTLVAPEAEAPLAQEVPEGTCSEAPEGYERWDRDVNISESQGQRSDITFREQCAQGFNLHRLSHIHGHPRFRYFVFEKEDDKGVLHRWYHRDLHVVWDEEHQHFSLGSVGHDDEVAYHSLSEVEVVDPVAVLMRP